MRLLTWIRHGALLLYSGRLAASQSMGRHNDWITVFLGVITFFVIIPGEYSTSIYVFVLLALTLGSNLLPSEISNHSFELIFTSRLNLHTSLLFKFFSLFFYIWTIVAALMLSLIPFYLILREIINFYGENGDRTLDQKIVYTVQQYMTQAWFHSAFAILLALSLTLLMSSIIPSQIWTIFSSAFILLILSRISDYSNPFFNAVPSKEVILPYKWGQLMFFNRMTLLGLAVSFIIISWTNLRKIERYM
ncbi:hypothetical protein ACFL27_02660 [candidate division CSSED10-310 bacterium]|uniref:ABC transporter permease n=1 Tax=candidate division CSSED10-310 bacterium TaxID=2855610 RepID=A0ABV6YS97_UNCC1